MRFIPNPEFVTKLGSVDGSDRHNLASFLEFVASATDKDAILDNSTHLLSLGEEIYVYQEQSTGIYFTFGNDADGEYLLLLDVTTKGTTARLGTLFSTKDPSTNSAVNPRFNSAINPRFNSAINPRFNSAINPRLNSTFGGPYLYTNELTNAGYLVKANENVDLIFELSGEFSGFLVSANEQIRVQFDTSNQWVGYVVKANEDVALRYTIDGKWIGSIS